MNLGQTDKFTLDVPDAAKSTNTDSHQTQEARLQSVQTTLAAHAESPMPEITNLVDRLTQLIGRRWAQQRV